MFEAITSFMGVSVKDLEVAKNFYSETLGLKLESEEMGLRYQLPGGGMFFIYPKADHEPATFTILNFVVEDIDVAVDTLRNKGVNFEFYENMPVQPDDKGIMRGRASGNGPDIAWFKDPSDNILSVLQDK